MRKYSLIVFFFLLGIVARADNASRYQELTRSRDIRAIEKELKGPIATPYRDSLLYFLHDCYANAGLEMLEIFYDNHKDACLKPLKAKDKKIISAYNKGVSFRQLILQAAPYRVAYAALQQLIADDLQHGEYIHALLTVREFEKVFGDDKDYWSLRRTLEAEDQDIHKKMLPAEVNRPKLQQYSPVISADGRTLFFCQRLESEDVYASVRQNFPQLDSAEVWSLAQPLNFNSPRYHESPVSVSADGNTLLVFVDGTLYQTTRNANGWGKLTKLPPTINCAGWQADATMTADGKAMLFAAWKATPYELKATDYYREGTYMRANIFVSLRDELGNWSKPIDLGPTINTQSQDRSPFMHPDGRTLYFASSGHGSLGSLDVFMSKRIGDGWTEWTEPVNLGREINTIGKDWGYSITTDGTRAYFVKDNDIYYCNLPKETRPDPVATVTGQVTDQDGRPVDIALQWEDLTSQQDIGQARTNPIDGSYFIVLPLGKLYGYFVNDKNYYPTADNIDVREVDSMICVHHDIRLTAYRDMIEKGTPVTIPNLFFDYGKADIRPESNASLERVAEMLKQNGQQVEISGHTDNQGSATINKTLSEARANAVREFLIQHGCDPNKLKAVGYGESRPVATNDTEEGRQQNRRVELRFTK